MILTGQDRIRFEAKFTKGDGCWEWNNKNGWHGYGGMAIRGRFERSHRIAYELYVGGIPEGACVLHTCDNPRCVNPAHLRIGTQLENVADRNIRHRTAKGRQHGSAKLNADAVREIRRKAECHTPRKAIAATYGVSVAQVGRIVSHVNWKYLD